MNSYSFKGATIGPLITLLLLSISTIKAQGLQVGNRCPDIEIKRILNYTSDRARLSDFIGTKALLIDFWFSYCTACLESFPKLDSIQKEFKDDLNILLVTYEPKEKMLGTFNRFDRIKHIKLPSVFSDTLLNLIFPHRSSPHEIWIDKHGEIKAITDHTEVNRANISALIAGRDLNLPVKKDNMDYSAELPLISTLNKEKILKYDFISTFQEGVSGSIGIYVNPDNGYLQARAKNISIQELYVLAYNKWGSDFNYNLVFNETKQDELRKLDNKYSTTYYCYESWWRDTCRDEALLEMRRDLDKIFSIKSRIEKRKIPCIVLRKKGSLNRFRSGDPSGKTDVYYKDDTIIVKNVYLKYPVANMFNGSNPWSPFQFIDETGYLGKISILLPRKFESIAQVNSWLKNVDLELNLEYRWMDIIILK